MTPPEVLRAVVEGDLAKVKKLVQQGESTNIWDYRGNTPLHVAVIRNLSEIVDYLLTLDVVAVNSRNLYGETALFIAVKQGHLHLVEKLIGANSNVNLSNFEDATPLHISVNYPELALLLVQSGANINATNYKGETPLHEAVSERCIETVCMLLYHNADANVECNNNITPFMKSIILENLEIQEILLDYVVEFTAATRFGTTVLSLALRYTCPYVKEIIDGGADVNHEHCFSNAFHMCLQFPNVHNFRLVWKDFKYQKLYRDMSCLELLIQNPDVQIIYDYLRVIIDSGNLEPFFEGSFDFSTFFNFLKEMDHNPQVWLQITSEIICLYLCLGNVLNGSVICQIYELFGYNDLLHICLHMDIQDTGDVDIVNFSMATIFYNTRLKMAHFKTLVSQKIEVVDLAWTRQFLPYIRIAEPLRSNLPEEHKSDLETLYSFASLLELSRNAARDSLVEKFSLFTSKQYHLFIQNLPISTVYKNILTFQKPVYTIKR